MSDIGNAGRGISVVTDALRTYSTISRGMATDVAAASGGRALASQVELAGAFGPIGKGFLAAFHKAEAAHLHGASRVSMAHEAMAQQSDTSAASYDATDEQAATATDVIGSAVSAVGTAGRVTAEAGQPEA